MSSSESSRRFHFIREIASGGFGSVYLTKVIHADGFSRLQAVKLLHPRWSENEEIAARMRDEARLLGWLRHKNIVDVMDLTLIDGRCAVLMEYLEAVDVKVLINHCAAAGTRIPLRAALEIVAAVASALDAAYNRPPYAGEKPLRVIHRDIKPSNVMIDDSGVVKVLDFGVARAEFDERESKTQEMAFGSLEYMPPERLFFEPESPASDVYSLGATLYEMLALEKFGKAKLRPKEHEQYLEDRFDLLLDRYPLHQESEDLLHELLASMLAFDEPDRPSAADCVTRMRAFARRLPEHPLEEWAETVVPPLLKASREREELQSPGSLVGSVLTEDAKALDQRSLWDENTGISTRALDMVPDDELTGSLADDARWRALKQATIEDMAKRGELGPRTGTPPPPVRATPSATPSRPVPDPAAGTPTPVVLRPLSTAAPADPDEEDEEDAPTTRELKPLWRGDTSGSGAMASRGASLPAPGPAPDPTPAPPARPPATPEHTRSRSARRVRPPPRRSTLSTVVLMFLLGAGLGLVAVAGVMILFAVAVITTSGTEPTPMVIAEIPDPPPVPVPPPPAVEPDELEEPDGPRVVFASARPNTTRMKVSCTDGEADGVDRVAIPSATPGDCTVLALTGDGSRLRVKVTSAEARDYLCFVADSRDCR